MSPSLRKFPFPYGSMFALCSDVDHAVSQKAYLDLMTYLNTDRELSVGRGVGLECSNSFWFFNAENDAQLSYFKGVSHTETAFAPHCRALWQSGHVDILHSYGDFNRGGFQRRYAEQALEVLDKQGVTIPVWVNHGNDHNHQKIGNYPEFRGAKPDDPAYHLDLLSEHGTRFFWAGRSTHVAGQDASFSLGNQFQQKLQKLVLNTKYRKIQRPLPDPPNRLLIRTQVQDGRQILEFQRFISRFGEVKNTDFIDLGVQLSEGTLGSLRKSGGFMLLYTHMNENLPEDQLYPFEVRAAFERLKRYQDSGDILVTTASRLLSYADVLQHLQLRTEPGTGGIRIMLERDDHRSLQPADLMGITLFVEDPDQTRLFLNGSSVAFEINPVDSDGRASISIPWRRLEFPY